MLSPSTSTLSMAPLRDSFDAVSFAQTPPESGPSSAVADAPALREIQRGRSTLVLVLEEPRHVESLVGVGGRSEYPGCTSPGHPTAGVRRSGSPDRLTPACGPCHAAVQTPARSAPHRCGSMTA